MTWHRFERKGRFSMRVLSCYELLCARADAGGGEDAGLRFNCSVLSRAIVDRGKPLFRSAQQVMEILSVEQIATLTERYRALCQKEDLLGASLFEISQIMRPIDRLRCKVLREFGVLPSAPQAKEMTDGDVLFCAAALQAEVDGVNSGFDPQRFEELR